MGVLMVCVSSDISGMRYVKNHLTRSESTGQMESRQRNVYMESLHYLKNNENPLKCLQILI